MSARSVTARRAVTALCSAVAMIALACGDPQPAPRRAAAAGPGPGGGELAGTPAAGSRLDVDGNGEIEPYTDALLIFRYTVGLRGAALTEGAVATDCTRCSPAQIETYLSSL